jgi:hypothetical protein
MKLQTLETMKIAAPGKSGGKSNEDRKGREVRMRNFWSHGDNAQIFNLGKLLSINVEGKTLAELLVQGQELELSNITAVNGVVLPLQPNFKLSLKTLAVWGCPACRSAHGSGVYPSRETDAELLAANPFYYNPKTKALFTISRTCWGDYVKGLGAATRFVEVPDVKPAAKPVTKTQTAPATT